MSRDDWGPNDADIEMAELEHAANAAAAIMAAHAPPLDPATASDIIREGAAAAWYGDSIYERITDAIADRDLIVTSDQFDELHWTAGELYTKWQRDEEAGRDAGPNVRRLPTTTAPRYTPPQGSLF